MVLRQQGIDFYNQWVDHEVPFNDPQMPTVRCSP